MMKILMTRAPISRILAKQICSKRVCSSAFFKYIWHHCIFRIPAIVYKTKFIGMFQILKNLLAMMMKVMIRIGIARAKMKVNQAQMRMETKKIGKNISEKTRISRMVKKTRTRKRKRSKKAKA